MKKIKDITVVTGSYVNKMGEEKKRYQNVGSLFEDNGNLKIKLDVIPLVKGGWDGWANCYDPKPYESTYEGKQTKESEDDIPF
jgi:hypothetical protein